MIAAVFACAGCGGSPIEGVTIAEVSDRAPVDTRRLLFAPAEMAVLRADDSPAPASLVLGGAPQSDSVLLLRFVSSLPDDAEVTGAFVLLSRSEDARPPKSALAIEVSRILDPWTDRSVSWGRQPRTSLPEGSMTLTPRLADVLRVDVTSIVRAWPKRRPDDHGIALRASGDDPSGWSYALGTTQGRGPVLEVYVR